MKLKTIIGIYKVNTMGIRKLFFDSYGPPMFSAVMSRNRFAFILHNLSFDDKSTRAKWKLEKGQVYCDS